MMKETNQETGVVEVVEIMIVKPAPVPEKLVITKNLTETKITTKMVRVVRTKRVQTTITDTTTLEDQEKVKRIKERAQTLITITGMITPGDPERVKRTRTRIQTLTTTTDMIIQAALRKKIDLITKKTIDRKVKMRKETKEN